MLLPSGGTERKQMRQRKEQGRGVAPFTLESGGIRLTGLEARSSQPARGLVVALHGGGYDCRYWHREGFEAGSLLLLGAQLGFDVIAFDRPGYAGSALDSRQGRTLDEQAELLFGAIAKENPSILFLIGHSMGGILALDMAARDGPVCLGGIDVSGVPLRFGTERQEAVGAIAARLKGAGETHAPVGPMEVRRDIFFSDAAHFDPRLVGGPETGHPIPLVEFDEALLAPERLPELMPQIAVPVQWTVAAHEKTSEAGREILAVAESLLSGSRHMRTALQSNSGHNISLHHVARAYHLRAFAFFEECLALPPA